MSASFVLPKDGELEFSSLICQWLSGNIVLLEHDKYRLVTLENLDQLSLASAINIAAQMLVNSSHTNPEK